MQLSMVLYVLRENGLDYEGMLPALLMMGRSTLFWPLILSDVLLSACLDSTTDELAIESFREKVEC